MFTKKLEAKERQGGGQKQRDEFPIILSGRANLQTHFFNDDMDRIVAM
jgi:hypothetical protein